MDALIFIVDTVLTLGVYLFLLRFLLVLVRANFRNPLAQAIVTLTQWLVAPLRRVLPSAGAVDTASLVATFLWQLAATAAVFWLVTGAMIPAVPMLLAAARQLLITTLQLYSIAVFIYALMSFLAQGSYHPATGLLSDLCEPLLRPIRRLLPVAAGLDFSPLVLIIGLQALRILIS